MRRLLSIGFVCIVLTLVFSTSLVNAAEVNRAARVLIQRQRMDAINLALDAVEDSRRSTRQYLPKKAIRRDDSSQCSECVCSSSKSDGNCKRKLRALRKKYNKQSKKLMYLEELVDDYLITHKRDMKSLKNDILSKNLRLAEQAKIIRAQKDKIKKLERNIRRLID